MQENEKIENNMQDISNITCEQKDTSIEVLQEINTDQSLQNTTDQNLLELSEQTIEQNNQEETTEQDKISGPSRFIKPGRKKFEVPAKNKKIVPYGTGSCYICRMPYDQLVDAHNKVFNEGWSKERLRQWVRTNYGYSMSPNMVTDHFKKHISQTTQAMTKLDKDRIQLINMDIHKLAGSNEHLEEAFLKITEMTKLLSGTAYDAAKIFDNIDREKLAKEINEASPLKAMEIVSKFVRTAHDLYRSASSLRAPKVLIAQFLEKALEEVFCETGAILQQACVSMQLSVTKILEKNGVKPNGDMFSSLFKTISEDYEIGMRSLAKELMIKMMNNLEDLENIV